MTRQGTGHHHDASVEPARHVHGDHTHGDHTHGAADAHHDHSPHTHHGNSSFVADAEGLAPKPKILARGCGKGGLLFFDAASGIA